MFLGCPYFQGRDQFLHIYKNARHNTFGGVVEEQK
jgi:hypothetical protein